MNGIKILGQTIPLEEINMKIMSDVPWNFESKVTVLESSPGIDTKSTLAFFPELEKFKTKINEGKTRANHAPIENMKNLALHSADNKMETEADSESDEDITLMSRKIKMMIQK